MVFAHSGRPNDDIHTAHSGSVCTNVFLNAIVVHVESQLCALVAFGSCAFNLAHVRRNARNTQHAALLVEVFGHLLWLHSRLFHEVSNGRRVDVARTRAHHQAFERCQSHRRIYAFAELNGRHAGSVADVAGNDALGFDVATKVITHALRHVAMAGAVEAVTTNVIVFVELVRNCVEESVFGHGAMEGIIEHNHLRRGRHERIYSPESTQVTSVVHGC